MGGRSGRTPRAPPAGRGALFRGDQVVPDLRLAPGAVRAPLAEAFDHAHRRHLYHRALAPRAAYVELDGRYPRLRIADWQVAAPARYDHVTVLKNNHSSTLLDQ